MKLLLLGGTADARRITQRIQEKGWLASGQIALTYSVAGLVRQPDVPCHIISGGFRRLGGVVRYLQDNQYSAILDMTHPYAVSMSTQAINAAKQLGIPCWRFVRPAWHPKAGDQWTTFSDWTSLAEAMTGFQSVLLSVGQLSETQLRPFIAQPHDSGATSYVYRTAAPPRVALPDNFHWIKAIGPFSLADEHMLIATHQIDLIVTKNSGGNSTEAKLTAARECHLPVFMLERPSAPRAALEFNKMNNLIQALGDALSKEVATKPGVSNVV